MQYFSEVAASTGQTSEWLRSPEARGNGEDISLGWAQPSVWSERTSQARPQGSGGDSCTRTADSAQPPEAIRPRPAGQSEEGEQMMIFV